MYHGIIPIVENNIYCKCLSDLPVVVVESFKEVNEEFLNKKLEEFSDKTFNMDKLKVSWWIESIRNNTL
jgi:fructose-bisphosphate aldolase class 1